MGQTYLILQTSLCGRCLRQDARNTARGRLERVIENIARHANRKDVQRIGDAADGTMRDGTWAHGWNAVA